MAGHSPLPPAHPPARLPKPPPHAASDSQPPSRAARRQGGAVPVPGRLPEALLPARLRPRNHPVRAPPAQPGDVAQLRRRGLPHQAQGALRHRRGRPRRPQRRDARQDRRGGEVGALQPVPEVLPRLGAHAAAGARRPAGALAPRGKSRGLLPWAYLLCIPLPASLVSTSNGPCTASLLSSPFPLRRVRRFTGFLCTPPQPPQTMAVIFAWMRYSGNRVLPWYKGCAFGLPHHPPFPTPLPFPPPTPRERLRCTAFLCTPPFLADDLRRREV